MISLEFDLSILGKTGETFGSLSIIVLTVSKKGVFTVLGCDVETGVDNVPKLVREEVG